MYGRVSFTGSCVGVQYVLLQGTHRTGLDERIRGYDKAGKMVTNYYIGGTITGNSIFYSSSPNHYWHEICLAIVYNSDKPILRNGPICFIPH
jgi:hypothetical protein